MSKIYSFLGDFYHSHDYVFSAVKKAVDMLDGGVTLVDSNLQDISSILDKNPSAIIFATENRVNPESEDAHEWLTKELDEKITSYVKNGGNFIAIHAALASYPKDSKYVDMLKGYFIDHPQEHYNVRYTTNNKSPLNGSFDFTALDEHYVLHVDEANTNVFMKLSSDFGEGCAGWFHEYGKGRVIAIAPTHNKEGFEMDEVVRLYCEVIGWSLAK